jgi:hypothetical protein
MMELLKLEIAMAREAYMRARNAARVASKKATQRMRGARRSKSDAAKDKIACTSRPIPWGTSFRTLPHAHLKLPKHAMLRVTSHPT